MQTENHTMHNLVCYKTMPEWDFNTLPAGFRKQHNTSIGTWAKLDILAGKLQYHALDENGNVLESLVFDSSSNTPFVQPQAWHKVEPLTKDLRCRLSFYCQPQDYYHKKYQLPATHSEVLEAAQHIQPGKALDIGCGSGRNALFLQQRGFHVTAFDSNPAAIRKLQDIIAGEKLQNISASVADANHADMDGQYHLIISTVVMMFLKRDRIPDIIANMHHCTAAGGCNLIVCATDSADYPLSAHQLPFTFGFSPGELKACYRDWNIIKYNEDVGHLHRRDASGNPIALRFATLLARKKP